ncbi:hypothetical protein LQZ13_07450 [Leuconostoc mesenteroides]|uniref:hypothetical protein n=1 Tax=Leuconostoc mesenteroides TaxID=1245 RepID=UPI002115BD62|nr:hypothetical protein [Leuconostoc mesenteroides]UUE17319.1 hypothetical protein LQZ13_07450 [Leuconostoc mesenteroides]
MDWENYSLQTQNADWAFLDEMLRRSKSKKFELSDFFENYQHKRYVLENWSRNHLHKQVFFSNFDEIIRIE